jgi:hypothetical protein
MGVTSNEAATHHLHRSPTPALACHVEPLLPIHHWNRGAARIEGHQPAMAANVIEFTTSIGQAEAIAVLEAAGWE